MSNSAFDSLEQDAKASRLPTQDELNQLENEVKNLQQVAESIRYAEQHLKDLKNEKRRIEMEAIPNVMDQAGISSFELNDGTKISVKDIVSVTLPKKNEEKGFEWLQERGAGDLIKAQVIAKFGREELEEAYNIAERLRQEDRIPTELKESVSPQTLSAWAREQLSETGELPPDDIFTVFTGRQATVKPAK